MHAISGPSVSTMLPNQQVLLLEESTAQCVTAALALDHEHAPFVDHFLITHGKPMSTDRYVMTVSML